MDNRKLFEIIATNAKLDWHAALIFPFLEDEVISPELKKYIEFMQKEAQCNDVLEMIKNTKKPEVQTTVSGVCPFEFVQKIKAKITEKNFEEDTCFIISNALCGGEEKFFTEIFEQIFPNRVFSKLFTTINIPKKWPICNDYDYRMIMGMNYYDFEVNEETIKQLNHFKTIVIVESVAVTKIVSAAIKCNLEKKLDQKSYLSFIGIQCGNQFC